jgi:hypothetical protein
VDGNTRPRTRPASTGFALRCEGRPVATTEAADDLIERVSDALFFDVEVNLGRSIGPGSLESRSAPRRRHILRCPINAAEWRPGPAAVSP